MKKKIEEAIYDQLGCNDDTIEAVKDVLNLLPRPRFPEKDEWPDGKTLCLFCYLNNQLILGKAPMRIGVKWYIPASEIINLVEGN